MNGRDIKANQLRSVAVSSGRLEVCLGWGVEEAYYVSYQMSEVLQSGRSETKIFYFKWT